MKQVKFLLAVVVALTMGLSAEAQSKKDTTVIFKAEIDCPSCKAKLEKNLPFEKGVKDFKVDMEKSTVMVTYRTDKNEVNSLKAAIEKVSDVKIKGMCDKDGKMIHSKDAHKGCSDCSGCSGEKKECGGGCEGHDHGHKHDKKAEASCTGGCGENCCSKTGDKENCCKAKKK